MKRLVLFFVFFPVFTASSFAHACENQASTEFMREKGQHISDMTGMDCDWTVREKKQNIPEPTGNSNYQNRMPTDAELEKSNLINAQEKLENQTQNSAQNAGGGQAAVQQEPQVVEDQDSKETEVIKVKDENNQIIQGNGSSAAGCGSGMGICSNN